MNIDYLIKNAKVVDGSGTPWFYADVAISGDRILRVGHLSGMEDGAKSASCKVIDAAGKVLAPGFIDTHTHFDLSPFPFLHMMDSDNLRRLRQGITTQIAGCCGISPAPVTPASKAEWLERTFGIRDPQEASWSSFGEYLDALSACRLGTNYSCYVGHGALRHCVMGYENRPATPEEISRMQELLAQAMEQGAVGMSSGLIYAPGLFAPTEELVALGAVLKEYNGIYASHIRSENARWLESVDEVIHICEANGIPGIVHHLKTKARESEDLVAAVLTSIADARRRGVDVVFEQYPYEASATDLSVVLSGWMLEGGKSSILKLLTDREQFPALRESIRKDYGWKNDQEEWEGAKNMLVLSAEHHPEYAGKTVDVIARELHLQPVETVFRILVETDLQSGAAFFGIKESDIRTIMQSPYGMIGSDSGDCREGETTHPRCNGTFPRVLGSYVREKGVISLEQAVHKMTGFPAARFSLRQRGLIRDGFFADLVLFDEQRVLDRATYLSPFDAPEGIEMVWVNGQLALQGGQSTGFQNGRVLRPLEF